MTISARGRSHSGEQLTEIAEQWLREMGYGEQPYLIIFHKDTANNHVHVVSTRVDKKGKKISSAYEKLRAMTALNRVMKLDEVEQAKADLAVALTYNFSTKPQFMLLLEAKGYAVVEKNGKFQLVKSAKVVHEFDEVLVADKVASYAFPDARQKQMTAIFHRYAQLHDTTLVPDVIPLPGGLEKTGASYHSDFSLYLKQAFGWELVFHGKPGKPAYGYTIIDHEKKQVFKGGQVMDIKDLLEIKVKPVLEPDLPEIDIAPLVEEVSKHSEVQYGAWSSGNEFEPVVKEALDTGTKTVSFPEHDRTDQIADQDFVHTPPIDISISDDIDDEAIHGRNRQRKRQARTNTR